MDSTGAVASFAARLERNSSMPGHPSMPILPAAIAVGGRLGASGTEVLAAKFSLEYCVAAALVDGRVGLTFYPGGSGSPRH